MSLLHLIVVAIVQGFTEFLPISSSAHLILVPIFGDWPDQGPTIDIAAHLGSLGAVVLYLRRDVADMLFGVFSAIRGQDNPHARLFLLLLVGTLPALTVGFILASSDYLLYIRSPVVIAWATLFFALLLWAVDKTCRVFKEMDQLGYSGILIIGVAQILALIPGTSRSGITITAARSLGYTRPAAARISLLLSIPIIFAATFYASQEVMESGQIALGLQALVAAILAFLSALLAITWMMRWLEHSAYTPFVVYRLILGGVLLCWLYA